MWLPEVEDDRSFVLCASSGIRYQFDTAALNPGEAAVTRCQGRFGHCFGHAVIP